MKHKTRFSHYLQLVFSFCLFLVFADFLPFGYLSKPSRKIGIPKTPRMKTVEKKDILTRAVSTGVLTDSVVFFLFSLFGVYLKFVSCCKHYKNSGFSKHTQKKLSSIMPLSLSDVKDIRALTRVVTWLKSPSQKGHSESLRISDHLSPSLSGPLKWSGVLSNAESRSDLSSGHLCFLRFSLCHFCVIFRHGSRAVSVVLGDTILRSITS